MLGLACRFASLSVAMSIAASSWCGRIKLRLHALRVCREGVLNSQARDMFEGIGLEPFGKQWSCGCLAQDHLLISDSRPSAICETEGVVAGVGERNKHPLW